MYKTKKYKYPCYCCRFETTICNLIKLFGNVQLNKMNRSSYKNSFVENTDRQIDGKVSKIGPCGTCTFAIEPFPEV